MKQSNKIKFIYFDIGGVMVNFKHQFEELEKQHGVNEEIAKKIWVKHLDRLTLGQLKPVEVWKIICKVANARHLLDFDLPKFRSEVFIPIEETHKLIRKLENSSIGIGIISNAELGVIDLHLQTGKIPNIKYRKVVDSSVVGLKKPDLKIFEYAQSILDIPKNNVLLVDDLEKNCDTAIDFGWQAYKFDEDDPAKSVKDISNLLNIK